MFHQRISVTKEFLEFVNALFDFYSKAFKPRLTEKVLTGSRFKGKFPPPTMIETYLIISMIVYEVPPSYIQRILGYSFYAPDKRSQRIVRIVKSVLSDDKQLSQFLLYRDGKFICVFCGAEDKDYNKLVNHVKEHIISSLQKFGWLKEVVVNEGVRV